MAKPFIQAILVRWIFTSPVSNLQYERTCPLCFLSSSLINIWSNPMKLDFHFPSPRRCNTTGERKQRRKQNDVFPETTSSRREETNQTRTHGSTMRKGNHGAKFQRKQEQDNSQEGGICTTYARTQAKGLNNILTWSDARTGNPDDRTLTQCSVDDGGLDEWTADMGKRIIEWYLNKFAHDGIGFVFWTKYYRMT